MWEKKSRQAKNDAVRKVVACATKACGGVNSPACGMQAAKRMASEAG